MKLVVVGAAGRMGRALIEAIAAVDGTVLSGAVEREGADVIGADAGELAGMGPLGIPVTDDSQVAFAEADGVVDFTAPAVSVRFAELAAAAGIVHVIGTTGMQAAQEEAIQSAAVRTAIIKSGNMSLGVNLLSVLVRQAARALEATDWDIEVLEMHHKHKVDAPSGTALLLGEAAALGRDIALDENSVRVRDGITGPREKGSIGFATLRGGSVVGEHSVILAGEGERIELTHRALDRSIFARGAVKAALWGKGKDPGLYSMLDVLGISED
ncbi:MAG: 4-hydroxy-tetrahydrodipicolinate reductase [Hyphomicrobiales bacterium]|nr:4-hydroxy-tetrahydrodipicolinate reductase [Hyphomicrobiales bacterium]MCP5001767.1 4-hydroxy-tetrahydrodipicolinate reductase [Hyphomicrobiales bacterium]